MKRILSLFLSLCLLLTAGAAWAETSDTASGDTDAAAYAPITFPVGDNGQYQCVITGFAARDADTIRQLVQEASAGETVELSSIVDAEKTSLDKGTDSLLCWAGSTSNLLWLSGWAKQCVNPLTGKNFASEDEVFDYFRSRFTDGGSTQIEAISWFFNGLFPQQSDDRQDMDVAHLKDGDTSADGFLKQVCAGAVATEYQCVCLETGDRLNTAAQALAAGNLVGLCIDGHALTLLGYICDPAAEGTDSYYKSLLIADSDNSVKGYVTAPAQRPNTVSVYTLTLEKSIMDGEPDAYVLTDYTKDVNRHIISYTVLKPYSQETLAAAAETDPTATLDERTTGDLQVEQVYFTSIEGDDHLFYSVNDQEFPATADVVYAGVQVINRSLVPVTDTVYAKVTVTRQEDGESRTLYLAMNEGTEIPSMGHANQTFDLKTLFEDPLGTYTVTAEVNPADGEHARVTEAYYGNNTYPETHVKIVENDGSDAETDGDDDYEDVPAPDGNLIPDGDGVCSLPYGEKPWGIWVIEDPAFLKAFEVSDDGETWTAVSADGYNMVRDDDGTFRLELTEAYATALGEGEHTFRVNLDGEPYTVKVTVELSGK